MREQRINPWGTAIFEKLTEKELAKDREKWCRKKSESILVFIYIFSYI